RPSPSALHVADPVLGWRAARALVFGRRGAAPSVAVRRGRVAVVPAITRVIREPRLRRVEVVVDAAHDAAPDLLELLTGERQRRAGRRAGVGDDDDAVRYGGEDQYVGHRQHGWRIQQHEIRDLT